MIRDKINSVIQDARSNTMNNKYGNKKIILTENYTDQILAIIRSEMEGMAEENFAITCQSCKGTGKIE